MLPITFIRAVPCQRWEKVVLPISMGLGVLSGTVGILKSLELKAVNSSPDMFYHKYHHILVGVPTDGWTTFNINWCFEIASESSQHVRPV